MFSERHGIIRISQPIFRPVPALILYCAGGNRDRETRPWLPLPLPQHAQSNLRTWVVTGKPPCVLRIIRALYRYRRGTVEFSFEPDLRYAQKNSSTSVMTPILPRSGASIVQVQATDNGYQGGFRVKIVTRKVSILRKNHADKNAPLPNRGGNQFQFPRGPKKTSKFQTARRSHAKTAANCELAKNSRFNFLEILRA